MRASGFAEFIDVPRRDASRHFQSVCGERLYAAIQEEQIAEAKRQLTRTKRLTADIAKRCGFGGVSAFYAVFRELAGMTPTEYRASK